MKLSDAIQTRRSNHYFDPQGTIPDETLREVFELAAFAPSGYNLQPWEFVVVQDKRIQERLKAASYGQQHVVDAAAVILVLGNLNPAAHAEKVFADWVRFGYADEKAAKGMQKTVQQWQQNWPEEEKRVWTTRSTQLAAMQVLLALRDKEIGATPMEGFDAEAVRQVLEIPDSFEVVMMIAAGPITKEQPPRLPRRSPEEFVHRNSMGAKMWEPENASEPAEAA